MTQFGNLRAQFGEQQVANGLANCAAKDQANAARDFVNSMPIPQCEKDKFLKAIDNWEQQNTQPCCADCQEACDQLYNQLMQTAGEAPSGSSAGGASAPGTSTTSGGGPTNSNSALNDAVTGAAVATNQAAGNEEDEESGKTDGKTSGNWLVELAKAMAEIQNKFLQAAMKNKDTMNDNAAAMDNSNGTQGSSEGGSQGDFLNAQSAFQANMQMFNMMMSMTNNMLKTLGQALNTMASQR
jgi:hypothetical protein